MGPVKRRNHVRFTRRGKGLSRSVMIRNPSNNMIDAIDALKPAEPRDADEIECRPIVFVLGEHGYPICEVVAKARQCVETGDKVRVSRKRIVGYIHPVDPQTNSAIRLQTAKFLFILKGQSWCHLIDTHLPHFTGELSPSNGVHS